MVFNSREYDWSKLSIIVGGKVITGARAVSYKESQEKEAIYGKGNRPVAIQRGNVSYDGSLTVLQSEYNAMKDAAGGSVLDLSTNIVVTYGNKGDVIRTDTLVGVEFTEAGIEFGQGDKHAEIELPFLFLEIR